MGAADPDFPDPVAEANEIAGIMGADVVSSQGSGHYPQADNPELVARIGAVVCCAPDQVGAWGAVEILRTSFGLAPTVISGPATDNEVGCRFIRGRLDLPAANARSGDGPDGERVIDLEHPFGREFHEDMQRLHYGNPGTGEELQSHPKVAEAYLGH